MNLFMFGRNGEKLAELRLKVYILNMYRCRTKLLRQTVRLICHFFIIVYILIFFLGFNDKGELWRNDYESPNFVGELDHLWEQVKPLYNQLHRYVGKKLKKLYGNKLDIGDGYIPAHVFGVFLLNGCKLKVK